VGLETGTTLPDLNPLWPLGVDNVSVGDDHLRLIKSVLQQVVSEAIALDPTDTSPQIWSSERLAQLVGAIIGDTGSGKSMAVIKTASQVISANVPEQVVFDAAATWDDAGWYAANDYTVQEAGTYQVHCSIAGTNSANEGSIQPQVRIDGALAAFTDHHMQATTPNTGGGLSVLVRADVGQAISIWAHWVGSSGTFTINDDAFSNWFQVSKISNTYVAPES